MPFVGVAWVRACKLTLWTNIMFAKDPIDRLAHEADDSDLMLRESAHGVPTGDGTGVSVVTVGSCTSLKLAIALAALETQGTWH